MTPFTPLPLHSAFCMQMNRINFQWLRKMHLAGCSPPFHNPACLSAVEMSKGKQAEHQCWLRTTPFPPHASGEDNINRPYCFHSSSIHVNAFLCVTFCQGLTRLTLNISYPQPAHSRGNIPMPTAANMDSLEENTWEMELPSWQNNSGDFKVSPGSLKSLFYRTWTIVSQSNDPNMHQHIYRLVRIAWMFRSTNDWGRNCNLDLGRHS